MAVNEILGLGGIERCPCLTKRGVLFAIEGKFILHEDLSSN
jgi:hypothetical protein